MLASAKIFFAFLKEASVLELTEDIINLLLLIMLYESFTAFFG